MTGLTSDSAAVPHAGGELLSSGTPPRDLWGRVRGAAPVALLIVGVLVGGGAGAGVVLASSDPTKSSEYQVLQQKLRTTEAQVAEEKSRADAAERAAAAAAAEVRDAREALVMGQSFAEQLNATPPR
jgi:hypothetical protein